MKLPYALGEATSVIYLNALRHNYHMLATKLENSCLKMSKNEWPGLLPVVKADAYGHGAEVVTKTLLAQGCSGFCSGSVVESVQLRKTLGGSSFRLVSLLGAITAEQALAASAHNVVCVVHSFEQLALYEAAKVPLQVAVKCDSGMARLGFSPSDLPQVIERLCAASFLQPVLLVSHLAAADDVGREPLLRQQIAVFGECIKQMRRVWPDLAVTLGNSAGLIQCDALTQQLGYHSCRPGLALYGLDPFCKVPSHASPALQPVMEVVAPVLAVRQLQTGEGTGYDLAFSAPAPMHIALVGLGYAHGYSRSFSNMGALYLAGQRCPVVGRVSMQMTAVDISALPVLPKISSPAYVFGNGTTAPDAMCFAQTWGSIAYEATCLLGKNTHAYTDE